MGEGLERPGGWQYGEANQAAHLTHPHRPAWEDKTAPSVPAGLGTLGSVDMHRKPARYPPTPALWPMEWKAERRSDHDARAWSSESSLVPRMDAEAAWMRWHEALIAAMAASPPPAQVAR